jgi:uncharacterized membrane protein YphA (DoxX/SURF4 family)
MASLNLVTGFLYGVVQHTWLVAAVAAKYLLLANLGLTAYQGKISVEKFDENLRNWAKPVLLALTGIGTIFYITNFSVMPVFRFFSELVAVGTLGYLFWKY